MGSGGTVAAAAITVSDAMTPTVTAMVVRKTQGGQAGYVKQAGTYFVYANATDAGDPVTGVSTVTADVSAISAGQTAVPLVAGSYVVQGVTYGYRSAVLTADVPLGEGTTAFTVSAIDGAGNVGSLGGSVTIDDTQPGAADVQTANASGGTLGRAETNDTITLTFSEAIEPDSIIGGWVGTPVTVTVRLVNDNTSGDRIQVWDAANTSQLPFGEINLGRTDYTNGTRSFTGSTMVLSGTSVIVVTLGTPSGGVRTAGGNGTMVWTPVATPYDLAANACLTTPATESGAADREF